ncbi:hypothetical protein FA95DRAFT_990326 [Auriscalpium vulgare]|uniref:Uncharacterized protein n=1 Tax=Auriscalpium vulgare TaxID=40419 RepID=A0ACB8R6X5_9AGAM|nr:hypothetical protein FA95DRAFT_990326 [Auriscalpium vulgare]
MQVPTILSHRSSPASNLLASICSASRSSSMRCSTRHQLACAHFVGSSRRPPHASRTPPMRSLTTALCPTTTQCFPPRAFCGMSLPLRCPAQATRRPRFSCTTACTVCSTTACTLPRKDSSPCFTSSSRRCKIWQAACSYHPARRCSAAVRVRHGNLVTACLGVDAPVSE